MNAAPSIPAKRILVVMPNWLGDAVMATPFLRELRTLYPDAHIAALHKPLVAAVLSGSPFVNEAVAYPTRERKGKKQMDAGATVRWMKQGNFDLAILLPNSFRSAWMAWRAGIPQRIGYAREMRSWLLTRSLFAPKKTSAQRRADQTKVDAQFFIKHRSRTLHLPPPKNNLPDEFKTIEAETVAVDSDVLEMELLSGRWPWSRCYRWTPPPESSQNPTSSWHVLGGTFRVRGFWWPKVGPYQPYSTLEYYLDLMECVQHNYFKNDYAVEELPPEAVPNRFCTRAMLIDNRNQKMHLGITEAEAAEATQTLLNLGLGEGEPFVILIPGANFGSSKCWPPERFAAVADRLMDPQGDYRAHVLIGSSPAELSLVEAIEKASALAPRGKLTALAKLNAGKGVSLGALKELVRRCRLMVCNDTGPRHFAAALDRPVVTLFGPTDPRWAEVYHAKERQVSVPVPCGPCQLKKCPIDHRCMTRLSVEMVMEKIAELWESEATTETRNTKHEMRNEAGTGDETGAA